LIVSLGGRRIERWWILRFAHGAGDAGCFSRQAGAGLIRRFATRSLVFRLRVVLFHRRWLLIWRSGAMSNIRPPITNNQSGFAWMEWRAMVPESYRPPAQWPFIPVDCRWSRFCADAAGLTAPSAGMRFKRPLL
jgi:hypothetical protein